MAERDELGAALAASFNKRLADRGFRRVGRRDLLRLSNGIVQLLNFQVSAWGSRDFCVNVAAFTLCGNDSPVLDPGFRLRNADGGDLWLPSKSREEALASVETAWRAAEEQGLPWLERNATLEAHLEVLKDWGSQHHQLFQIGVVEAMLGRREEAIGNLAAASRLYAEDGRPWCAACIAKTQALIGALQRNADGALLEKWGEANLAIHRIKRARA